MCTVTFTLLQVLRLHRFSRPRVFPPKKLCTGSGAGIYSYLPMTEFLAHLMRATWSRLAFGHLIIANWGKWMVADIAPHYVTVPHVFISTISGG